MEAAALPLDELFPADDLFPTLDEVMAFLADDIGAAGGPAPSENDQPLNNEKDDKAELAKKAREKAILKRARRRETDARARKKRADQISGMEAEIERLKGENDRLTSENAALATRITDIVRLHNVMK